MPSAPSPAICVSSRALLTLELERPFSRGLLVPATFISAGIVRVGRRPIDLCFYLCLRLRYRLLHCLCFRLSHRISPFSPSTKSSLTHTRADAFFFVLACGQSPNTAKPIVSFSWVLLQLAFQSLNVVVNTGIHEGPLARLLSACLPTKCAQALSRSLLTGGTDEQRMARLRFLARRAILYNQANVSAILITPLAVALFINRDGYFTIRGSGVLLFSCHLRLVLQRFLAMLCLHPAFALLTRWILKRRMRKHLLKAIKPRERTRDSWLHGDGNGGGDGDGDSDGGGCGGSVGGVGVGGGGGKGRGRGVSRATLGPAVPKFRPTVPAWLRPPTASADEAGIAGSGGSRSRILLDGLPNAEGGGGDGGGGGRLALGNSAAATRGRRRSLARVSLVAPVREAIAFVKGTSFALSWRMSSAVAPESDGATGGGSGMQPMPEVASAASAAEKHVKATASAEASGRTQQRRQRLDAHAGVAQHDLHDAPHRELNYLLLKRTLIVGSWRYFGCAILFVLFATFPRHLRAPLHDDAWPSRLHAGRFNGSGGGGDGGGGDGGGTLRLPPKHAWMWVGAEDELRLDPSALAALRVVRTLNVSCAR